MRIERGKLFGRESKKQKGMADCHTLSFPSEYKFGKLLCLLSCICRSSLLSGVSRSSSRLFSSRSCFLSLSALACVVTASSEQNRYSNQCNCYKTEYFFHVKKIEI